METYVQNGNGLHTTAVVLPTERPGYKVAVSPFAQEVSKILLATGSVGTAMRFLESKGFKVDFKTMQAYQENYLSELNEKVKDELVAQALAEKKEQNKHIVATAVHAGLSLVDSVKTLLIEAEAQLTYLKSDLCPSNTKVEQIGKMLDRILELRQTLEETILDSQVEIERRKAIYEVVGVAAEFLRGKSEAEMESFKSRVMDVIRHGLPASQ